MNFISLVFWQYNLKQQLLLVAKKWEQCFILDILNGKKRLPHGVSLSPLERKRERLCVHCGWGRKRSKLFIHMLVVSCCTFVTDSHFLNSFLTYELLWVRVNRNANRLILLFTFFGGLSVQIKKNKEIKSRWTSSEWTRRYVELETQRTRFSLLSTPLSG